MKAYGTCLRGRGSSSFGLTLMEVLVTLAIILILAAVLLPAVNAVKKKAREARCMSNLAQIGKNLRMYVSDNGEFPLSERRVDQTYRPTRMLRWEAELEGIRSNVIERTPEAGRLYDCPSASTPRIFERLVGGFKDYGYNKYGAGGNELPFLGLGGKGNSSADNFIDRLPPAVKEGEVKAPSRMFAVGGGMIGCGKGRTLDFGGKSRSDWPTDALLTQEEAFDEIARRILCVRRDLANQCRLAFSGSGALLMRCKDFSNA